MYTYLLCIVFIFSDRLMEKWQTGGLIPLIHEMYSIHRILEVKNSYKVKVLTEVLKMKQQCVFSNCWGFFSVSYTSWLKNSKNRHFFNKHFTLNTGGNIFTPFSLPVLTNGKVNSVTHNTLLFAKTLLRPQGLPQNQNMGIFKVNVIFSKVVRPVLP